MNLLVCGIHDAWVKNPAGRGPQGFEESGDSPVERAASNDLYLAVSFKASKRPKLTADD